MNWTPTRVFTLVGSAIVLLFMLFSIGNMVENVDANEIVVIQDPVDGELHWHITPGVKWQMFGRVTVYQRRDVYEFENAAILFNDAGGATLVGSVQYDMPLDAENLTELHIRYGSPEAIKDQVIKKTVDKVIYMTGPLMSSRESYAEKRTQLIEFAQDQIANGIYQVVQQTVKDTDPLSGQERTTMVAQVAVNAAGQRARGEESVVAEFGIRAFNFAIQSIDYSEQVDAQIRTQQEIIQNVQKSIAQAREAEQQTITTEQQGQANAAKTKWEQEALNAQLVAEAEGRKRTAEEDKAAADFERQAAILRAQGQAESRRLLMQADNALDRRLLALENINKAWADAFANARQPLVPGVVMGGGGNTNATGSTQDLMNMITLQTARQLGVNVAPAQPAGNNAR